MKLFLFLFIFFIGTNSCFAQEVRDSVLSRKDTSVKKPPVKKATTTKTDSLIKKTLDTTKSRTLPPKTNLAVKKIIDTAKKLIAAPVKPAMVINSKQDSLIKRVIDTTQSRAAITVKPQIPSQSRKMPDLYKLVLSQHPYFNFVGKPRYEMKVKRVNTGKDGLFYLLTGLVFYFALVRLLFSKYLSNLFAVFFRVSLKQKQIREQLLQSPLPSLLLNVFFIIAGGIYISFLLRYYHFVSAINVWVLILYSIIALGAVYLGKYLILKVLGWIFNIGEATDTYIFVIFLVNKLLGILLVPFLVLLAFSSIQIATIIVTLSFTMVAILFAYRYIISYAPVRKEIKVSQFHFFLYLCAFELIPLLLIYKVLLTFLERNS